MAIVYSSFAFTVTIPSVTGGCSERATFHSVTRYVSLLLRRVIHNSTAGHTRLRYWTIGAEIPDCYEKTI